MPTDEFGLLKNVFGVEGELRGIRPAHRARNADGAANSSDVIRPGDDCVVEELAPGMRVAARADSHAVPGGRSDVLFDLRPRELGHLHAENGRLREGGYPAFDAVLTVAGQEFVIGLSCAIEFHFDLNEAVIGLELPNDAFRVVAPPAVPRMRTPLIIDADAFERAACAILLTARR
jgi:hypothetical protein